MTPRRKILVSVLLLAVTGAVVWQSFRPRIPDPIFEGRHLSYWIGRSSGTESLTAQAAVRAAGTNAIPMLLRFMRAHDSAVHRHIVDLTQNLDLSDKQLQFLSLHFPSSDDHSRPVLGFEALGPDAKSAVQELLQLYKADPSADSRIFVVEALGAIGPCAAETKETIPLLTSVAANTNDSMCQIAVVALIQMRVEPDIILPMLMTSLDDPARMGFAAWSLGKLGPQAKSALPRLLTLRAYVRLHSSSSMLRLVNDALNKIDPKAAENAGIEVTNVSAANEVKSPDERE